MSPVCTGVEEKSSSGINLKRIRLATRAWPTARVSELLNGSGTIGHASSRRSYGSLSAEIKQPMVGWISFEN